MSRVETASNAVARLMWSASLGETYNLLDIREAIGQRSDTAALIAAMLTDDELRNALTRHGWIETDDGWTYGT